jgi:peptidoglycan/xylan/chitin deacetylase (PgdA/CDA1 family)|tara:strand:- start:1398 stop:2390 length:993 start_codon:yes stop_codon:yes gene_type:complete
MTENKVTIVMYHFVRDEPLIGKKSIHALSIRQFVDQLNYMEKYYYFVTMEQCIEAIYLNESLPPNSLLLTFDDGYSDHYYNVFPILVEKNIQGCFFSVGKILNDFEILDVNKIQLILASTSIEKIIGDLDQLIDQYKSIYGLKSWHEYESSLYYNHQYDSPKVTFVKALLQKGLKGESQHFFINELFRKYVTCDEEAVFQKLYMDKEQLQLMIANDMFVGTHSYSHFWLDELNQTQQEAEIEKSVAFLKQLDIPESKWVMSYPYGAYNSSLINILKTNHFKLALTDQAHGGLIASLKRRNAFKLERLDANDFLDIDLEKPNKWTQEVVSQ